MNFTVDDELTRLAGTKLRTPQIYYANTNGAKTITDASWSLMAGDNLDKFKSTTAMAKRLHVLGLPDCTADLGTGGSHLGRHLNEHGMAGFTAGDSGTVTGDLGPLVLRSAEKD